MIPVTTLKSEDKLPPPPKHDFCFMIRTPEEPKIQRAWYDTFLLHLDIICQYDMGKHPFELIGCEESTRTTEHFSMILVEVEAYPKATYQACFPWPKARYSRLR